MSQLPFGWVCFSNISTSSSRFIYAPSSQLPFGWVCFSNNPDRARRTCSSNWCLNCLSAGSVSLTQIDTRMRVAGHMKVSIAFRLGLFL